MRSFSSHIEYCIITLRSIEQQQQQQQQQNYDHFVLINQPPTVGVYL